MAQNITLLGASYSDVPSVTLPKTGGGTASFTDVTDTTATAEDVAQGKYFYTNAGVRTEGTATGGGGYTIDEIVTNNVLTGVLQINATTIRGGALSNLPYLTGLIFNEDVTVETITNSGIETIVAKKKFSMTIRNQNLENNLSLRAIDAGSLNIATGSFKFRYNPLNTLVIRQNTVAQLAIVNHFNNTPFASGGDGGTLYVPQALISSYQSASNWSTLLGYANNQIKSIESTHTDPTAPIDLTLYYVDGTPIS